MAEISSVSRRGKTEPFELQVSRGQIAWHRPVVVFGFNPDVDTTPETIWPGDGLLPYPSSPIQMKVSSGSTDDASAGTGARTVYIGGLDANHNEISEVVTMNGQTDVLTTKSYLHINQAYVMTAGSLNSAAANIYIGTGVVTAGVPATVYDIIAYDYNNRITGSFTIPAGYTGYLVQGLFSSGQAGGSNSITGRLMTRGENNIRLTAAVTTLNNGAANYSFEYPVVIPEKTTVEAQGFGSSVNNACSSMFIINLIKNDGA
jgi:hypothetical protein